MRPEFAAHIAAHGGITGTDVIGTLISDDAFRTMVRRQELVRIHRGVYRHAVVPLSNALWRRAGLLAVGPGGVLSHRTAIDQHGIGNFECALVEITHRSRSLPLREGLVLHRSSMLRDRDVVIVDGLPTTSRARTLVDASAVLPPSLAARYAQSWLSDRRLRLDDLADAIDAAGNHTGAHALRRHVGELVADADSPPEADLGRILDRAGIGPELHHVVTTASGHTYELDWAYPWARLGLEMDGYGVHLRSSDAFEHDRFRRNELEISGWTILNFTSTQLRRSSRVVDQVRRALAASS